MDIYSIIGPKFPIMLVSPRYHPNMTPKFKQAARVAINGALSPVGLEIRRKSKPQSPMLYDCLPELIRHCESPADRWGLGKLWVGLSEMGRHDLEPHGQLLQDAFALGLCGEGAFFAEIGAGNPLHLSNTYLLDRHFAWSGLRVEPNPHFAALQRNEMSERVTLFETVASGSESGFCELILAGELSQPFRSTSHDGYDSERERLMKQNGTQLVSVTPIKDILEDARAPKSICYLSIDTEGSETDILQNFPFTEFDVTFISIEHNHNKSSKRKQREILLKAGFVPVFEYLTAWESWYVSKRVFQ